MYSAILMMAMTGSAAQAPAWPWRGNEGPGCAACASSGQHIACYGYSLNCVGFACFGSYPTYFVGPVSPYHFTPAIPAKTREGLPPPKSDGRDGLTKLATADVTI